MFTFGICNKFGLLYSWLYWNISLLYKLLCNVLYNILFASAFHPL